MDHDNAKIVKRKGNIDKTSFLLKFISSQGFTFKNLNGFLFV